MNSVPVPDEQHNERAGSLFEMESSHHEPRYYDAVGRPRKLASGAMTAIQREFKRGASTRELASRYGVSVSLVLTICYFTPKKQAHYRPAPQTLRPVIYPVQDDSSGDTDD
jgi:hypothetical protein